MATLEKKLLSVEVLESQTALELPDRQLPALVNIFVNDVLSGIIINVPVGVAANLCGISVSAVLAAAGSGAVCDAQVDQKTYNRLDKKY